MSAGTPVDVKICGIRTVDDYDACKAAGAAFVGMVFFPRSPRHLSMQEAGTLADHADRYSDGPAAWLSPSIWMMLNLRKSSRPHARI